MQHRVRGVGYRAQPSAGQLTGRTLPSSITRPISAVAAEYERRHFSTDHWDGAGPNFIIDRVYARCMDANQQFVLARLRDRHVFQLQDFRNTESVDGITFIVAILDLETSQLPEVCPLDGF